MNSEQFNIPSPLTKVSIEQLSAKGIRLYVKRDDLIHPEISGNKWRKLHLNLEQAQRKGRRKILTFGGAFSNHIAATAEAARIYGLESIGIIRGLDADIENPTLSFALECGMEIIKISRDEYKNIDSWDYLNELKSTYGDVHIIPQGGANFYGVQGCISIVSELNEEITPHRIFLGSGTATTASGIIAGNRSDAKIYPVSALKKGEFLGKIIENNLKELYTDEETVNSLLENVELLLDYHFGGFGKITPELVKFMRDFYQQTNIKLDPIYNAKAAYALSEIAKEKKDNKKENWVLIHTGGLQGIAGMEKRLGYTIY